MSEPLQRPPAPAAVTVVAVLGVLYTLYFARDFLIPIVFSVLLAFVLSPVVRLLARLRLPEWLGAGIVVLGLVAAVSFGTYQLAAPVQAWAEDAPATLTRAERAIKKLLLPLESVTRTAEQVEHVADGENSPKTTEVVVRKRTIEARLLGSSQRFIMFLVEVFILLYFLLAAGSLFLEKLIKVLPNLQDKKTAVRIARRTESSISTYLIANLGINVVEGVMVGGAMWALGMPAPLVWGLLTVVLEFIPYLGALAMLCLLSITALGTFDHLGHVLLVPAAFLLANLIQANIVTTLVLGKRLALNPVALFVGLAFWFWIWGIPGAFIGVPLVAIFKIVCDNVLSLAPIGEFLSLRAEPARVLVAPEDQPAT